MYGSGQPYKYTVTMTCTQFPAPTDPAKKWRQSTKHKVTHVSPLPPRLRAAPDHRDITLSKNQHTHTHTQLSRSCSTYQLTSHNLHYYPPNSNHRLHNPVIKPTHTCSLAVPAAPTYSLTQSPLLTAQLDSLGGSN